HSNNEKTNFVGAYNELKQYYLGSNIKQKLTESEFDPSQDAKTISAIQSIKNSSNSNKLISTIGKYISSAPKEELDKDDPLYSGIIDLENIENQKPCLFQNLSNLTWLDENKNEIERDGKQLVRDIKRIWNNSYYQERSRNDKNIYELFFVEVSYGPFYQDPEPHIDDNKKKLGKLDIRIENANFKSRITTLEKVNTDLKFKIGDLEKDNTELKSKNAGLERDNEKLKSEHTNLQAQIVESKLKIKELSEKETNLQIQLTSLEVHLKTLNDQYMTLLAKFEKDEEAIKNLEKEITETNEKKDKVEKSPGRPDP
ncbi:16834_t:CDS:2, partial [Gigaspora margarita]